MEVVHLIMVIGRFGCKKNKAKFSKQSGYNSGAEVQIPYLLILLSALLMILGTFLDWFSRCLHQLSHNDRVRLQELKAMDIYAEVVSYMLAQDVKLEQEIVSLTLMKGAENN